MSSMLVLLIGLLLGGALGLWLGCRYGCEGVRTFIRRCKNFLIGIGWATLYLFAYLCFFVILVMALIVWFITSFIEWIMSLPWRRWWQSLRWLWWLLAALLLFLALVLALLGFLPAAIGFALLGALLWLTLLGLIASIIVMLIGLLAWFTGALQALAKWLALLLAGVSITLPRCSEAPMPPAPVPLAAAPVPAPALRDPVQEEKACTIVPIEKGDGTIRATARGGHALGLEGSIAWTRTQGLPVRRVGRYVHAPTLYTSDHIKWCDDKGWILVRPIQR